MMNRPRIVAAIGIALSIALCVYGVVAGDFTADSASVTTSGEHRLPAIIELGDKGEILYDLHATINSSRLKDDGVDDLQGEVKYCAPYVEFFDSEKSRNSPPWSVHKPEHWSVTPDTDGPIQSIEFNAPPIDSFGVYGDQTSALVTLFQLQKKLRPTGQVDAVTLHYLEPLRPASRPTLNAIMYAVQQLGVHTDRVKLVTSAVAVSLILLLSAIAWLAARSSVRLMGVYFDRRRPSRGRGAQASRWFDQLRRERVFLTMAHLAPAFVMLLGQFVFPDYWSHEREPGPLWAYPGTFLFWSSFFRHFGLAYIIFSLVLTTLGLVNACEVMWSPGSGGTGNHKSPEARDSSPVAESRQDEIDLPENGGSEATALSGIIRFTRGTVKVVGVVLVCAALVGTNPLGIIGGIGAFMAIILLVFKDSILGLVASVNIISQKTVQLGDWIEMPKYGVDGDVASISLTTIRVRNIDKTIVSIPTYSIMADSFKNWRGMQEAGGRRIKRAIHIDMNTIRPVDLEMCERFEGMTLLKDYISRKRDELREHYLQNDVLMSPANSRWLTNVGTYRVYLEKYLKQHASISPDLTCLVRQLQPTSQGLPIEICAFATETGWNEYERIQADIFDHAISILREFELRVFQMPSDCNEEAELPPIDHTPWHADESRPQE